MSEQNKRDLNNHKYSIKNKRNKIQPTNDDNIQPNLNSNNNIKTNRHININLIVRIRFQKKVAGNIIDDEDDLILYKRETIEHAFNRYTTRKNINFYFKKKKGFFPHSRKNSYTS